MSTARKLRSDINKLSSLSSKAPSYYYIHGFFVGLAGNPDLIPPSAWYPKLFGEIEFESEQQVALQESVLVLYNQVVQDCQNGKIKLPSQCKLPPSNIEEAVQPQQPLPQWCEGILASFNLIDTAALSYFQLNTLTRIESVFLAFTSYTNLRAYTRTSNALWQSTAVNMRRDLCWNIDTLIQVVRFDQTADSDEPFEDIGDPDDFLVDEEDIDEFEELIEAALYEDSEEAVSLLPQLIESFETTFGESFFAENAGHFWLIPETRSYMLLKHRRARVYFDCGKLSEAIAELQHLLRLNPNDNQGARYTLASLLVIQQDWSALSTLFESYDEPSAVMLASKALMHYANEPNGATAKAAKKDLLKCNKHLVKYLTSQKKAKGPSEFYQPGDASEVEMYLSEYGKQAWRSVSGALFWLRQK